MTVCNKINEAIIKSGKTKTPVVGSVATSANGNIVLTTIPPHNAEMLRDTGKLWENVFKDFPITSYQIQRPWIKLVAHGVPTEAGNTFQAECRDFNPVQVKGAVRWLKKPIKPEGSMVFAVDTIKEQQYCL